ncbi:hypothetical protein GOBAR_DD31468 [Gossypium barbadense]|nr:hypothetical protein GOBAR_DD31468 [Gossypium barbadense]
MSRGTNMIQTKLKSGRSKTERGGGSYLEEKANVNEEYKEVFRTKSYLETWTKVHGQLENTSFDRLSPSSSIPNHRINLSEYLLQPKQETLDKIESLNFHHLILDYFEAGLEGSNLCESLLRSIHQARVYYRKIRRVIKISKRIDQEFSDDKCSVIFKELAGFALLKNPFSIISPVQLRDFHESNLDLFHKLTSRREKLKRQAKFKRISKQIGSICLVISHTAFIIALLQGLERLCAQLDISAKGVYILINDFDTISRLVWRLHDEIEHRKAIADMCIRNGKIEVLKEVEPSTIMPMAICFCEKNIICMSWRCS